MHTVALVSSVCKRVTWIATECIPETAQAAEPPRLAPDDGYPTQGAWGLLSHRGRRPRDCDAGRLLARSDRVDPVSRGQLGAQLPILQFSLWSQRRDLIRLAGSPSTIRSSSPCILIGTWTRLIHI